MDSDAVTAAATFIAACGTFVVAIVGAMVARANSQRAQRSAEAARVAAESSKAEIVATKEGVFELGKRVDGRLSELLKVSIAAAHSEGVAAGEQSQRDRASGPTA